MSRFSIETVWRAKDKLTAPVTKMQNRIGKFTRSMEKGLRRADKMASKVLTTFGKTARGALKFAGVGLGAATAAVTLFTREYSKIEDAEAAFTPLLGGAEKAKKAVQALNDTAATTPFQFETLAKSAKFLLPVMNGNIERMIKTTRMLGDTAGGNAEKLESITRGFTKAMLKGKTDMESLNMIAEAGVPIFTELADSMGLKVNAAFFKLISAGKVTTNQLTKAFEKMTNKGGIFFNGMEIASKTTSGLFSTLKDNISLTAAAIGEVLSPVVKDLLKNATKVAQQVRDWVTANRELINERFLEFVNGAKKAIKSLYEQIKNKGEAVQAFEKFKKVISILGDAIIWLGEHGGTIAKITGLVAGLAVGVKAVAFAFAGISAIAAAPASALVAAFTVALGAIIKIASKSEKVMNYFKKIRTGISDKFSDFTDSLNIFDNQGSANVNARGRPIQRQTSSPNLRAIQNLSENRTIDRTEVTIKDESGRAEITRGGKGNGLSMARAGDF
jgi:tape measure domain-containing protein